MKFLRAPDDPREGWYFHHLSEGGTIHLAIHPVLHGFRIRAWFHGEGGCVLDWCCGEQYRHVLTAFALCHGILSSRPEDARAFAGLPGCSKVKPLFRDVDFMLQIIPLVPAECPPIENQFTILDLAAYHLNHVTYWYEQRQPVPPRQPGCSHPGCGYPDGKPCHGCGRIVAAPGPVVGFIGPEWHQGDE